MLHISEMTPERWTETSIARLDGKREFRERPQFGDRHAIFSTNYEWGEVHIDEFNALDFPNGTLDHASLYVNEQTGIPESIAKIGIIGISLYGIYKLFKFLEDK